MVWSMLRPLVTYVPDLHLIFFFFFIAESMKQIFLCIQQDWQCWVWGKVLNSCHRINVNETQCFRLNTAWTRTAWCFSRTTRTVLLMDIHLEFPYRKFPVYQCQLTHLYEIHMTILVYVHIWINAFDFADNWCDCAVIGSVCCAAVLKRSELWNETVIGF